jgi:hypothetical protein
LWRRVTKFHETYIPYIFQQLTLQFDTIKHVNPATSFSLFLAIFQEVFNKDDSLSNTPPPRRFLLNISLEISVEYLPEDFG